MSVKNEHRADGGGQFFLRARPPKEARKKLPWLGAGVFSGKQMTKLCAEDFPTKRGKWALGVSCLIFFRKKRIFLNKKQPLPFSNRIFATLALLYAT
jgi:hypothetical protein